MSVLLSWQIPGQAQPKQMLLDASVNEQHTTVAQVTEHQVEEGVNITDHIRPMPKQISIEGILTQTPINSTDTYGVPLSEQTFQQGFQFAPLAIPSPPISYKAFASSNGDIDRVKAAYPDLVTAVLNGYIFKVNTSLATYENMAAVNLSVPRNFADANHLHFNLQLQEVRIVSSQTATVNVPPTIAKGPVRPTTPRTLNDTTDAQDKTALRGLAIKAGFK